MAEPKMLKLPHNEQEPRKVYSMANPLHGDHLHTVRYWLFQGRMGDDGLVFDKPAAPTEEQREALSHVLTMAECYSHLTTYELGQEHCVRKLRDIWRALRARNEKVDQ